LILDTISQYFGVEISVILAPVSMLLSTAVGSTVAIITVRSHRKNARLKNSMDFINSYNEDTDIGKAIKEINELKKKPSSDIEKMATSDGSCENTMHIRIVLNYYEAIAICIGHKIYDETIIKETVYTTVLDMRSICLPYVKERRKQDGKETYYQEMALLTERWIKKPLKKKNGKRFFFF